MTLTAGVISLVSKTQSQVKLAATAASGGTGPYTEQWYKSLTTGFSPGGGNIISGATTLALTDAAVVPGQTWFYVVVYTDTGNSNVTINSAQFAVVVPSQSLSQNQFAMVPIVGQVDLAYNYDTISAIIDSSQATGLPAGSAVKVVNSVGGVPKVIGVAAASDEVFGFINYDIKTPLFLAGASCEISQSGNVMYLFATAAIARGAQVQLDISAFGCVGPKVGSSGADLVGFAIDEATAPGQLIRVRLGVPSFLKA